ncbi:MAG TPA: ABC transporter permease [Terriglobia bacterium]|nr:ABC transporter permease [Terriglobia bacterium]
MFGALRVLGSRIRGLFTRRRLDEDFRQELAAHLSLLTAENIRRGLPPEEARREARLRLGGVTQLRESQREAWGLPWLETLAQDVRYALRMLGRNPGFTAVAVLVLALGICASAAIFAFVDSALLKPLPYRDPGRIVDVNESAAVFPRSNLSYLDYVDWNRLNHVFSSLDVWNGTGYLLESPAGSKPVSGTRVSDGFFRTLGVTPVLGRDFYAGEVRPGAPPTAILSYPAWQEFFGGKPDVVGRTAILSGIPYTIVGVLPNSFQFALRGRSDFWTTLRGTGSCEKRRSCHNLYGVARLKDGVSVKTALAEMTSIAQQLERQYPDSNRGQGASVQPLSEVVVGQVRPILLMLLAGAGLLLLIACVNVTSLLLARSESRKREIAVRGALGASSARLLRQFATEGLVLAFIASSLGLVSSRWVMQLITSLIPANVLPYVPFMQGVDLSFRTVAFAVMVLLLVAALFALTPTLRLSLPELRAGLAEGSRGSAGTVWRRFASNLVVVELAIAMVLLVGAGLLGKSLYRLLRVDVGFQPDHLATVDVALPQLGFEKPEAQAAVGREILRRVSALPGVKSSALAMQLPVSFNGNTDWIRIVGRPYHGEHNEVNTRDISPAYFTTLQAKLLRGRYFTDADDSSKPNVAIINQTLARKYFPGEDPVGQSIGDTDLTPKSIKEIVGVVDDVREGSLDSDIWPTEYLPFNQDPDTYFSVVARTSQPPQSLLPTLDAVIHKIDPNLGTLGEATMAERIDNSPEAYMHRSSAWLVGGFAAVALLLGVVGLYGVIAYSVSRRTREIGVRMALGAERGAVYGMILKEAGRLAALGLGIGLAASVGAATLITKLLFGVRPWDAPTLAAVAAVLGISALLASYIPARRAARVDPLVALRHE